MKPKISFIIPMYNAEKYIGTCIESIIAQNFVNEDYEIIVIDDGSKDNSKEVAQSFSCVRYYWKENGGQSTARNMGIELALGKYICFVDADDYLLSNTLLPVLRMAVNNSLDIACYGMKRIVAIKEQEEPNEPFVEQEILNGGDYIAKYEYNNGPWWYLIKTDFIRQNSLRFVEGKYGEDGMFTMQALLAANRVQSCNQVCYCYVEQPNSTTTNKGTNHLVKIMDDYLYVSIYMRGLAEEYKDRIPCAAYERLIYRSESYLFFLLARLLRFPHAKGLIDETVNRMKEAGAYPIRRPNPKYYRSIKYPIVTFIVNNIYLLKLCNWIISMRY